MRFHHSLSASPDTDTISLQIMTCRVSAQGIFSLRQNKLWHCTEVHCDIPKERKIRKPAEQTLLANPPQHTRLILTLIYLPLLHASWVTTTRPFWGSPGRAHSSRVMFIFRTAAAAFQRAFTQSLGWHQAVKSHHDNHPGNPKMHQLITYLS